MRGVVRGLLPLIVALPFIQTIPYMSPFPVVGEDPGEVGSLEVETREYNFGTRLSPRPTFLGLSS